MPESLTTPELINLIRRVFQPGPADRGLGILVDLPDAAHPDHPAWEARRLMAMDWLARLHQDGGSLGLRRISLILYPNAGRPNAPLPDRGFLHAGGELPEAAEELRGESVPFEELFRQHQLFLAPTEFSATAPLKLAAKTSGFRAATMPGFNEAMIPALRLDYMEISHRCRLLKDLLDRAEAAWLNFEAGGEEHELLLDLRHRAATASGGMLPDPGTAGNLPSGETFIVPYEGEIEGLPSRSAGRLPLEIDGELMVLGVDQNRVVEVKGDGPRAAAERQAFAAEPAYANLAELGLGILADYGIRPIGELLLDEKLGLHIAFGRSDHFGGRVGVADFSAPEKSVHLDRVYIPETQPGVLVLAIDLLMEDGSRRPLMRDGHYIQTQ